MHTKQPIRKNVYTQPTHRITYTSNTKKYRTHISMHKQHTGARGTALPLNHLVAILPQPLVHHEYIHNIHKQHKKHYTQSFNNASSTYRRARNGSAAQPPRRDSSTAVGAPLVRGARAAVFRGRPEVRQICPKRRMYIKRDVCTWKETYVHKKRPIHMKRDQKHGKRRMYINKDLFT